MTTSEDSKVAVNTEEPEDNKNADHDGEPLDKTTEDAAPDTPEDQLEEAQKKAQESYDRFLRASAELENYKKRTQKETAEFKKYANATLVKDLLAIVDNLERAIASANGSNEEGQLSAGLDLTLKELLKILEKYHVCPIDAVGKAFDPCFHQAMMQQESDDQPENVVLQEMQKGYMIHDRLLRPAMVIVSKSPDSTSSQNDKE